jgi:hypothetical protein
MKTLYLTLVLALLMVGFVSANAYVTGTVKYQNSTPVNGASVQVDCNAQTEFTSSDTDGTYIVYFASGCDAGDNASVTATKDAQSGTNTGQVCNEDVVTCPINVAVVDVTIPEFTVIGATLVALAGIGIIAYRRRN